MAETSYCPRHSDTATNLRCSRCNALVCPACMVHSPVGVRCPDCVQATKFPVYTVSVALMARAIAASVLMGAAGGLMLSFVLGGVLFGILYLAAMAGFGYVLAEGVSVAADRKRGRALQFVAAGGALVALAITVYVHPFVDLFYLLGTGLAVYVAVIRLR